ncbi:hypothetical protein PM10SUCC1_04330 [Propionigenium maris DSM 9537]|uniref:Uncharacterized protein n=1 Tax=Propionigenium maris DSM 9537 TaxID=1123000 RepID=A0A9W6LM02_9FUSO|nr:hypothetical protein PM10SUCC1_04330 [Propionigenium maris DSM 9537]
MIATIKFHFIRLEGVEDHPPFIEINSIDIWIFFKYNPLNEICENVFGKRRNYDGKGKNDSSDGLSAMG